MIICSVYENVQIIHTNYSSGSKTSQSCPVSLFSQHSTTLYINSNMMYTMGASNLGHVSLYNTANTCPAKSLVDQDVYMKL